MEQAMGLTAAADRGASWMSRTPRCKHTLLTKPECHCRACLSEQIAAHGHGAKQSAGPSVAARHAVGA
jgi:hypothetical protein